MSAVSYVLSIQESGKLASRRVISRKGGQASKIVGTENTTYVVTDVAGKPVTQMKVRQKNGDLQIFLGDRAAEGEPDLVIENYARVERSTSIGTRTEKGFSEFVPDSPSAAQTPLASGAVQSLKAAEADSWSLSSAVKSPWFIPAAVGGVAALAALTKGSSSNSSSSTGDTSALGTIKTYASGGANATAPTQFTYTNAGISGVTSTNVGLVNSAVQRTKADTADKINPLVTAANKIIAEANGPTADTSTTDPVLDDYKALQVNLSGADVNTTQLGLLNDIIKQLSASDVNTTAKIDALAATTNKLVQTANDSTNAVDKLTLAELLGIGLVDMKDAAVAGYQSAIRATANDGSQIKSFSQLKAIGDAYLKIFNLADGGDRKTNPTTDAAKLPTAADYAAVGVTLPTTIKDDAKALSLLNNTLDGFANTHTAITKVSRIPATDSDFTLTELVTALDKVHKIRAAVDLTAAKAVGLTVDDLKGLGFANVSSHNLDAMVAALQANKADTDFSTYAKLQTMVNLGVVIRYADSQVSETATQRVAPTLQQYQDIGLASAETSGNADRAVTGNNVTALNNAVDALSGANVDTKAKLQSVLNAYQKILDMADNSRGNADTAKLPTAADYATVGVTLPVAIKDDANALTLFNNLVDGLGNAVAARPVKVQASDANANLSDLAAALAKVFQVRAAADLTAAKAVGLTAAELNGLGFANVSSTNFDAMLSALLATKSDSHFASFDSYAKLQTAINLGVVVHYANTSSTDTGRATPTLALYQDIGLSATDSGSNKALTSNNLAALNSAVEALSGADVDSKGELQTVLNAYAKILAMADGTRDNASPMAALPDYTALGALKNYDATTGVIGGSTTAKAAGTGNQNAAALALINSVIDGLPSTAVDSVAEINKIAISVDKVMDLAAGTASTVTQSDLSSLGLTGVTSTNISKINDNIKATSSSSGEAVDSLSELQALVSLSSIQLYAADRSQSLPSTQTYRDLSLSGITWDQTLTNAINSALPGASKTISLKGVSAGSNTSLEDLSLSYQSLLREFNDTAGANTDPLPTHYEEVLGGAFLFSGSGTAAANTNALSLINDVIRNGKINNATLSSKSSLTEVALVVDKLIGQTSEQKNINFSDLNLLGLNTNGWTDNSGNTSGAKIAGIRTQILNSTDGGADINTWAKLKAYVDAAATL